MIMFGSSRKVSQLVAMMLCAAVLVFQCGPAEAGILKKLKGGGGEESAPEAEASAPAPARASYKGPKQVVAVGAFEGAGKLGWDEGPVMAAMLQDALMQTGRFIVVERQQLDSVLKEQDLGAAGRINSETALKIGQIVGASIMIQGTVTQFEPGESGKSGRVNIPIGGIGGGVGLGGSKVTSKIAMKLRIIDLTTSQVLSTHNAEHTGTHKSMGMDVYTGIGSAGGDQFKKTPLGETAEECINKCVDHIISVMANVPFSARVAEVDGKSIYINAGTNRGVTEGMVLGLYKTGKVITDPDTGLALDVKLEKTGSVKVDSVQDKLSVCSLVEGQTPKRGDTLRLEK